MPKAPAEAENPPRRRSGRDERRHDGVALANTRRGVVQTEGGGVAAGALPQPRKRRRATSAGDRARKRQQNQQQRVPQPASPHEQRNVVALWVRCYLHPTIDFTRLSRPPLWQ